MQSQIRLSPEQKDRLIEAILRFPTCRILVVGDIMLDTFIWGEVNRISPEAPVPVVEVREESQLLGGSANVAHNVAGLGGKTAVAGVVGNDHAGRLLLSLFEEIAVSTDGLVIEDDRPTTVKTRIIAQHQQVVRFDREWLAPLKERTLERILSYIEDNLPNLNGIIVSDYAKGVVSREFLDALRRMVSASALPVVVDPKVQHADLYRSFTMVTPNHHEASQMSGTVIRNEETLIRAGKRLLELLACETVLITRGKEGMSLFQCDGRIVHIPTVAQRVFDVTGAGDTVIAAMTLGIVAGLAPEDAALLANLAAGIVVGQVGTAAVLAGELLSILQNS
ncbi:MAG TPA: D-glycero-beta-D-manno-heptose-7-phosphate kinase [Syntrophobacteraceae bacterium]|nr:D-glycero-beta-D-manno-heptose-7-phosphate kinase [Syntrophobacteraceae bacterium]